MTKPTTDYRERLKYLYDGSAKRTEFMKLCVTDWFIEGRGRGAEDRMCNWIEQNFIPKQKVREMMADTKSKTICEILYETSSYDLTKEINKKLEEGWDMCGNIVVFHDTNTYRENQIKFYQKMTKLITPPFGE